MTDRPPEPTTRRTARWNVALVAALLTSGAGVLLTEPALLLLSIPGVVFAAHSHLTPPPTPTLELERSIDERDPSHGEAVEVTVTLRNAGDRTLPDVRIADGVPSMLPVVEGPARHAAVLRPGEETTFSYTVTAKRGRHRFEPSTVVLRDASGATAVETTVTTRTELACRSPIETPPIDRSARRHAGAATTTDGGPGVEFSTIRSYRRGDPPSRIDWNRYARSGALTTVNFRDDRSRVTVLCLDARSRCYRSSGSDEPHAVAYGRAAARELLDGALESEESIGVAVFGDEVRWLAPGTGSHHAATARRLLEDPDVVPIVPPEERIDRAPDDDPVHAIRTRIERGAHVILLSPLLDDRPLETARTLGTLGHPVTVLSPDVTTVGSLGAALTRLRRENRLDRLRRAGVSAVDWDPETHLETAIRRGVGR